MSHCPMTWHWQSWVPMCPPVARVHLLVALLFTTAPHPAIRELGLPVEPAGSRWAVPKLGSSARNQGWAQMQGEGARGPRPEETGFLLAHHCQANQFLVPKPAGWLWSGYTEVATVSGQPLPPLGTPQFTPD